MVELWYPGRSIEFGLAAAEIVGEEVCSSMSSRLLD
jgi:hypothetical protein